MNTNLTGYPSIDRPWLNNFEPNAADNVNKQENMTLYQYMYEKNKAYPNEYALRYFDVRITYGELFKKVEKYAKMFLGYGIKRGDYVTICMPNVPETVYFLYALCRIGAVANMIDPRMNPQGIVDKTALAKSRLLIAILDVCEAKIDKVIDKLSVDDIVVVSPSDSLENAPLLSKSTIVRLAYSGKKSRLKGKGKYILLRDFEEKYYDESAVITDEYIPDTPISVTYTSGTTGVPKGAQFTNEAFIAQNKNMHYGADIFRRQDTFLGIIPMFSSYGSLCGVNIAMCCGWETILVPKFNPLKFDELIVKHKPNNVLGVPRFWETIVNSKTIDKTDLSFFSIPLAGGDKVTPAVLERINKKLLERGSEFRLKVGYGSTELGGAVATMLDKTCYEPGSVGSVLPGTSIKVVDPDTGKELSYNEDGEIYAYAHTQMLNYLNNPAETENITHFDENGIKYYRTGDKGHITESGILYIVDRYKRLMKRPDGHQVHATPIENALSAHKAVKSVAAVGITQSGTETGVIPTAFIIKNDIKEDNTELAQKLNEYCKERIADRDVPLAYVFVDKLPYTPMGKVDFKKLEENTFDTVSAVIVEHTFFGE